MNRNAILASAVSLVLVSMYGCAPDPMPFDPAKMQHNSRKVADTLTTQPMDPLPTTLDRTFAPINPSGPRPTRKGPVTLPTTGPSLDESPVLRLSLQEVIHRAVNNNLDIRVAGYDAGINSNRVVEAQAKFDPVLFFNPYYEWRNFQNNPNFLFSTPDSQQQKYELFGTAFGIRQNMETGGTAELRHETNFVHQFEPSNTVQYTVHQGGTATQPSNTTVTNQVPFDPYYTNNLVAELKQPLLKNFGTEVTTAQITVARNNQKSSILDFRKQLEESLFNVEQTYWQLVAAEQSVQITEKLLSYTVDTAERLTSRTTQDITRVELSQANSAVQARKAQLIEAKRRVRDLSDQLKRLMDDPELPVSSSILILPATDPIESPIQYDPQDQINQALEHRFELAQQLLKIDSASLITRVAKNNLLPELDLVNTLNINGAGASWNDANTEINETRYLGDRIGFTFEVPLGNREARAIYARTLLQRQQEIDRYRNLIDQVSLDVQTALHGVTATWDETIAHRQAKLAYVDSLEAINSREQSLERMNYSFVQLKLDTQQRWADEAINEVQSITNYCISVAGLERAKGTLLRYDNVMMEEDRLSVLARAKVRENMPEPFEFMPTKKTEGPIVPTMGPGSGPDTSVMPNGVR